MKYKSIETGEVVELVRVEFDTDGKSAVYDWTNTETGRSNRYQCDFDVFIGEFSRIEENGTEATEYPEGTKLTKNGLYTINEPSKPAHYDTAIDTIAFAKANFSREQVEGFMRINAIKYLQRVKKGQVLEDLKKSRSYIDMLIGMEEEKDENRFG